MQQNISVLLNPRPFTRREKTSIRQDVKRFEKIGRDHGCVTLEDYADFVAERIKYDEQGRLIPKSFWLFRGLVSYFGHQLLNETTLARMTGEIEDAQFGTSGLLSEEIPGWLLVDRFSGLSVFVAPLVYGRILGNEYWSESLDDLMDQIIDWNHGYLFRDEVDTPWIAGEAVEPDEYSAA